MTLRRLSLEDMPAAAQVHRIAFDDRLPWLSGLHTPDEDLHFFRDRLFPRCEIWGAFHGEELVGILAFSPPWIEQLYVLPTQQSRGLGQALLFKVKEQTDHLVLWTFQANASARRFYEAQGFSIVGETDGRDNEEKEPDLLYEWRRPSARPG